MVVDLSGVRIASLNLSLVQLEEVNARTHSDREVWWRAEDKRFASYDLYYDELSGSRLTIQLRAYPVIKHTPKGVVLDLGFGDTKFVLGVAAKQWAVPTKELALQDLVARKRIHAHMAELRLKTAREHLAAAEYHLGRLRHAE